MRIFSIASGSSGNCIFVGNDTTRLLVDAGVSGKRIMGGLEEIAISLEDIDGILVTHEHVDHIGSLGVLLRKREIPVYATRGTIDGILDYDRLGKVNHNLFIPIGADEKFSIKDISVEASRIWHDANEPVCYSFFDKTGKISIATDLGDFDEYLVDKLTGSDILMVESNHDVRMLEANQRYTYALKRRILSSSGHLSNERSGEFVTELMRRYQSKAIILGHLSKDNNIPECALINMQNYMREAGFDISELCIEVAGRDCCSANYSI